MNSLSTTDKHHLHRIATGMSWALIARVMKALNWKWYHIHGRTPNAGEIRDEALNHLTRCIQEARQCPSGAANLFTGGLDYRVHVCPYSGNVLELNCAFVLESCMSLDDDDQTRYSLPPSSYQV